MRLASLQRLILIILAFTISCPPGLNADEETSTEQQEAVSLNPEFLREVARDTGEVITSPIHWESEWTTFSIFTAATAGFMALDSTFQRYAQHGRPRLKSGQYERTFEDRVSQYVKPLGNAGYLALPLGSFYFYGHLAHDNRAKRAALRSVESLLVSNLLAQAMKRTLNRERPSGLGVRNQWGVESLANPGHAMPSGHATVAFAIATVFATEYADKKYVPPIAYTLATLTGLSRIHDNRHWASDVFVGACIGYFTSKSIMKMHEEQRFRIVPVIEEDAYGLGISVDF